MKSSQRNHGRERYYLLPGMGGKARWQKVRSMALWGLLAGLLTSALVATVLYAANRMEMTGP